jgi:riboflavin synthase
MFTGLIETVGQVSSLKQIVSGYRLRIRTSIVSDLTVGESVAINGVCLTVAMIEGQEVHFDVGPETARVTTLGALRHEQPVNIERAMRADSRFGGHLVQGHIDGTGTLDEMRTEGDAHWITVRFPSALAPLLIRKGSIAVDGISLTVAGLDERRFDVMIIPHTWTHTNLSSLRSGDRVNLECDVIGKYIARMAEVFARQP